MTISARSISLLLLAATFYFSAASAITSPPALSSPLFAGVSSNRLLVLRGGETAADADTTLDTTAPTMATSSSSALSLLGSVADKIDSSLAAGPHVQGIVAVYAVSFATVAALTMIRTSYAFSIGYGGAGLVLFATLMLSKRFRAKDANLSRRKVEHPKKSSLSTLSSSSKSQP